MSYSGVGRVKFQARGCFIALAFCFLALASCQHVSGEVRSRVVPESRIPSTRLHLVCQNKQWQANGRRLTYEQVLVLIRQHPGQAVFVDIKDFLGPDWLDLTELARTALASGGSFFFDEPRGAIDSIGNVVEFLPPR